MRFFLYLPRKYISLFLFILCVISLNFINLKFLTTSTHNYKAIFKFNYTNSSSSTHIGRGVTTAQVTFDAQNLSNVTLASNNSETNSSKECEMISPKLIGLFKVNLTNHTEDEIAQLLNDQGIELGGKWEPKTCKARHRVAILIPYRNRELHLKWFLLNMHPLFARQQIAYGIYIIELVQDLPFNRGLLFNVGFIESNKDADWDCHSFHDVDLISEDDRTLYHCPNNPTHLSYRISKFGYKPIYASYFGGATIMRKENYINTNGYSNVFYGWGGEDDDHYNRIKNKKYSIDTQPEPLGRYLMAGHAQETPNPDRFKKLTEGNKRFVTDGLNSVKYVLLGINKTQLYTKLLVSYNKKDLEKPDNYSFIVKNLNFTAD